MGFVQTAPWIAGAAAILFVAFIVRRGERSVDQFWWAPAFAAVVFGGFTVVVLAKDGFAGLFAAFSHSLWANQIWIDLLLALGAGLVVLAPEARRRGMRLELWGVLIVCSGSIGFLAMLARLMYLRARSTDHAGASAAHGAAV